MMTAHYG